MHVLGVLMDDQTLLVIAELRPTVTARLERIKAFTEPPTEAKFKATLADYGAFVATLEKPVSGAGIAPSATGRPDGEGVGPAQCGSLPAGRTAGLLLAAAANRRLTRSAGGARLSGDHRRNARIVPLR